jgi:hypothetical protein
LISKLTNFELDCKRQLWLETLILGEQESEYRNSTLQTIALTIEKSFVNFDRPVQSGLHPVVGLNHCVGFNVFQIEGLHAMVGTPLHDVSVRSSSNPILLGDP